MLRISQLQHGNGGATIRLEGKLLSPWVGEVQQAFAQAAASLQPPRLDLSAVSFADSAGIELLRSLQQQEVKIVACSGYVAELLQGESA